MKNGVHETTEFLELFLRNLLLDENNVLHNRAMHISGVFNNYLRQDIGDKKQDIGDEKQDIEGKKQDIDIKKLFAVELSNASFSMQTLSHIENLYKHFQNKNVFGRSDVMQMLGITASPASELIRKLLEANIIIPVKGKGKGKYVFSR